MIADTDTSDLEPPSKEALEPAVDPALASALEFEPLTLQAIDDESSGCGLDGICEELNNGLGGLSSPPPPTLEEILEDADYREEDDEIDGGDDDPAGFAFSSANSSTTARSLLDTLSLQSRGSGDSRSRTSASGRSGVSGRSRASRARARGLKAAQGRS